MRFEQNNVKVWASDLDPNTLLQAEKLARLPILAGHVALMPDAHVGAGATVGSVIATESAIIPAAVGVDIGCGMIAVRTSLEAHELPDSLDPLVLELGRCIPAGVGRGRNTESRGESDRITQKKAEDWLAKNPPPHELSQRNQSVVLAQLGTLGSGNHFVEVCLDVDDRVWVVLHSGSRSVGNQLAQQHIRIAQQEMKEKGQKLEDPDLAWLCAGTKTFDAYISDMQWAQRYAFVNREIMMDAALYALTGFVDHLHEMSRINCHHNFTQRETHFGKEVWLTRKGAIKAAFGDMGIIPGSMGAKSYITRGLGNADSYNSSSHGAGRRLSRGQAKRTLSLDSLREKMQGRAWNSNDAQSLLDEHPDAYKDIDQVMEDQCDLTEPIVTLRQIVNYKGV